MRFNKREQRVIIEGLEAYYEWLDHTTGVSPEAASVKAEVDALLVRIDGSRCFGK